MGLSLPVGFGSLPSSSFGSVNPSLIKEKEFHAPVLSPANEKKTNFSPSEERILKLLSDGHSQEVVAATLGITPSAISQCISRDDFRSELAARKSVILEKFKKLDDGYDRVEQALLAKLEQTAEMMYRPGEIVSALSKINAMKRRLGVSESGSSNPATTIVNITLPVQIVHKFTVTKENHVVGIDDKSLVTIPSQAVSSLANRADVLVLETSGK